MGRELSQKEKAKYCRLRHQQLEHSSKLIGIPIEEVWAKEVEARKELKEAARADTVSDEDFEAFVNEQWPPTKGGFFNAKIFLIFTTFFQKPLDFCPCRCYN